MITNGLYSTSDICPTSGIWVEPNTKSVRAVSQGQRFPYLDEKAVWWELQTDANSLREERALA